MSNKAIRAALETALAAISPALATSYVGDDYDPVEGTPYQQVFFEFADPGNIAIHRWYEQKGYMQVRLFYPLLAGNGTITARAELIQSTFKSGSVISGVTINRTPAIKDPRPEEDRLVQSVFVYFSQIIQEA